MILTLYFNSLKHVCMCMRYIYLCVCVSAGAHVCVCICGHMCVGASSDIRGCHCVSSLASTLTLRPELADLASLGSQLALHILKLGLQTGHYIHTSLAEPSAQAPDSTSKWK